MKVAANCVVGTAHGAISNVLQDVKYLDLSTLCRVKGVVTDNESSHDRRPMRAQHMGGVVIF